MKKPSVCVYLLLTVSLVKLGHCVSDDELPKFKIELIEYVSTPMNPIYAFVTGPQLTESKEELEKLCINAKEYLKIEWEKPENPKIFRGPTPGKISWNHEQEAPVRYVHVVVCGTVPEIWLRATESSDEFIIMVDYSTIDISDKEYTFKVEMTTSKPIHQELFAGDDNLQNMFKSMLFTEWMHVCMKAKEYVENHEEQVTVKPVWQRTAFSRPEVGHHLLKLFLYDYSDRLLKEYVTLECPIIPTTYLYGRVSSMNTIEILIVGS